MKLIKSNDVPVEERDGYNIKRLLTEDLEHDHENMGFYITTIPKESRVKMHYHPKGLEILIFLTKGTIEVEEGKVDVMPYDVIFLEPGEKHEISAADDDEMKLIAVRVPNYSDDKVVC